MFKRERTADDIIAPLTRMVDELKAHEAKHRTEEQNHYVEANKHAFQRIRAREHLKNLEAIFGKSDEK